MKKITLALLLFTAVTTAPAQTLDQSQLNNNSGLSARTLAGYNFFQSFTAGITGTLTRIDMGVFNYINGAGTLKVYAGSNNLGTLLQTVPVTVNCPSGNCFAPFTTSVAVTAGQVYTFQFIPGAGIPDPYGVQVQNPGTYPNGQFGLVDPSGTYYPGFDLTFRTYVTTALGLTVTEQHPTTLSPNPMHGLTQLRTEKTLTDASVVLYNLCGQQVKQWEHLTGNTVALTCDDITRGVYVLQLSEEGVLLHTQKLLVTE